MAKRFRDNNLGTKLRSWTRFTHRGEEFRPVGQAIATLACVGALMLVWTVLSMALRFDSSMLKPEFAAEVSGMRQGPLESQREPRT